MTPGQQRVLGLLIVLAVLELAVQPTFKGVLNTAWVNFNTALSNSAKGTTA